MQLETRAISKGVNKSEYVRLVIEKDRRKSVRQAVFKDLS